jgi:hypothetical protein
VAVVHLALTRHGWHASAASLATMTSVPRCDAGVHQVLVLPWGQVTVWVSQSTVKAVRSKPSSARAWGEVSASIRVTNRMP